MKIDSLPAHTARWTALSLEAGSAGPLSIEAFVCRGASVHPLALVVAGVHGDEYEGPVAVGRLAPELRPETMRGSVIAVPIANPMAFEAAQRLSRTDGLNLARVFPGNPEGAPTERLAAALFGGLARQADYLVDLHSGGADHRFLPVAAFYGPADPTNPSFEAARHFGMDTLWQAPQNPGVLSYEASRDGIVAIGCEYLGAGELAEEGVARYVQGLLSCLAFWKVTSEGAVLPARGRVVTGAWEVMSRPGLLRARCRLGDRVTEGQPLAETVDGRGTTVQCIVAPISGTVLAIRTKAYVPRDSDSWALLLARDAA